jgi:hypothetical protein
MIDGWGIKAVLSNTTVAGQPATVQRLYVDDGDVTNNWVKWVDVVDHGQWSNADGSVNPCGGDRNQLITWGGPVATFRWDTWANVDLKFLSVREIV